MKLTNVRPSRIEHAATLALDNLQHTHTVKMYNWIKEQMEKNGWDEDRVRKVFDIELASFNWKMGENKAVLANIILGAKHATNLGCKMELEAKELRLISPYLEA